MTGAPTKDENFSCTHPSFRRTESKSNYTQCKYAQQKKFHYWKRKKVLVVKVSLFRIWWYMTYTQSKAIESGLMDHKIEPKRAHEGGGNGGNEGGGRRWPPYCSTLIGLLWIFHCGKRSKALKNSYNSCWFPF